MSDTTIKTNLKNTDFSSTVEEKSVWEIIKSFFNLHGVSHHQIDSYNEFIHTGIESVVNDESDIIVFHSKEDKSVIHFGSISISEPGVVEDDRNLHNITPSDARKRDLNYDSAILCDITHTEYENGKVTENNKFFRLCIGRIPMMLGSDKCTLKKMTKDESIKANECEYDQLGYFIIRGHERTLVAQVRANHNQVIILEQKEDNKDSHTAEIRSMSEETGHSVRIIANLGEDSITLSIPHIKEKIEVGIILKALGFISDMDIINLIRLDDSIHSKLYTKIILRDSFFIKTQNEALCYIGQHSTIIIPKDKRRNYAEQVVETEMFPHLGISSTSKEKAMFIGHIIKKLIDTKIGKRTQDDRDNYANKRIENTGMLCTELFRTLFKRFISAIKFQIEKKKSSCDILSIISKSTIITNGFKHSFATGNWGVQRNAYIRTGVSQVLIRMNNPSTLSHGRRVIIPIGKEGKNAKIRQIHPSQFAGICPAETPEGASAGIVLNLALLSKISKKINTTLVKEILEKNANIIPINNISIEKINTLTYVFLNGIIIGMTDNPNILIDSIKTLRRHRQIHYDISVSYDKVDEVVKIFCDAGRIIRPLFTIGDDGLNINKTNEKNWDTLVENNFIEYLDNSEIESTVIAMTPGQIKKDVHKYCEIHPSMMLGVMASMIPFSDHSPSPRNCYQCSMGKQAMGIPTLSYKNRTDTISHVLNYPQKPLVSTQQSRLLNFDEMPAGVMAVVAILSYDGFNQEDSVSMNKGFIDRGGFCVTSYKTISDVEKKNETIELPPLSSSGIPIDNTGFFKRNNNNYNLLDDYGIVKKGVQVKKGDVIIGKVLTKTSKSGEDKKTDCSIFIKQGEEGIVDNVYVSTTPNGYKLVKISIRYQRIPEVGDKVASRAAQKGTIGAIYRQEDMPFNADGISPDIIINPHCIPSRMTTNQLMECVLGKVCSINGEYGDATPWTSSSTGNAADNICEMLAAAGMKEQKGYNRTGWETLMNGFTGEQIKARVFMGPTYYQRLKHMVSDKMHARSQGHVTTLTRQPLEGRSRDGGLRFGEMERDCSTEGTLISLSSGLSLKIENMSACNYNVLGWSEKENGIVKAKQTHFMAKGKRPCIELTLEDGRKVSYTEDHKLLSTDNEWIKVKDLDIQNTKLKIGITCPGVDLEEEIKECNGWTLKVGKLLLTTDTTPNILKTMAFLRILGYLITDGHITNTEKELSGTIFLGHKLDLESILIDLKLFVDIQQTNFKHQNGYIIRIPNKFLKNIIKLPGLLFGNKVLQAGFLPDFIKHKDCPRPMVREFLGGIFGGDGHTCYLGLHRGKRDILTSVSFSKTKGYKHLDDLKNIMEEIKKLLNKCGIHKITIQKIKEITDSKKKKLELENKHYELLLHLDISELIPFSEKVGFRYCCHKSQRLEAAVSYRRLREEVARQHNWLVNRVDEITDFKKIKTENPSKIVQTKKAILQAVKELKISEPILHEYAIPSCHDISDHLIKGTVFGKFTSKNFPTAEEFLEKIGALDWFKNENGSDSSSKCYGVEQNTDSIPTMNLTVLSKIPIGEHNVYDIQVEDIHSFLANGVVSHNCMIAHGASRFLKERLFDCSDSYQITVCDKCGMITSSQSECISCMKDNVTTCNIPYAAKLLVQELLAMSIKVSINPHITTK